MSRNFFKETSKLKNTSVSEDLKDWKHLDLTPKFHTKHAKQWQAFYQKGNYWGKRLARRFIQAQTIAYINKNKSKSSDPLVAEHIFEPKTLPSGKTKIKKATKKAVRISVKPIDCLYAAKKLVRKGKRVAVLNMANQFKPGGGYDSGAGAQEEDLFRRTNLIKSLRKRFYKLKRSQGFGEFNTLYSDSVTVLRKGEDENYQFYPKNKQFEISVISSAAYDLKFSLFNTSNKRYKEGTKRKIIMQLETAIKQGHKNLVLSAFGCGAFGNDPKTVAKLYDEVLNSRRYKYAFDTVTFAIVPNPGAKDKNYKIFKEILTHKKPTKEQSENSLFKLGLIAVTVATFLVANIASILSIPLTSKGLMISGLIGGAGLFTLFSAYFQNRGPAVKNKLPQERKFQLSFNERISSGKKFLPSFSHRIKKNVAASVDENVIASHQARPRLLVKS